MEQESGKEGRRNRKCDILRFPHWDPHHQAMKPQKQNPLPSAPKENPSTIQTELQSGFSPVPDVNLFLPFDKSSILKSSTNTAKKSKRKAQVQNNAKAVTKSAFKKDVKTKKVALNKPRMIATGSCASQKPYEKKGYLEGFVHSKRRKCLF